MLMVQLVVGGSLTEASVGLVGSWATPAIPGSGDPSAVAIADADLTSFCINEVSVGSSYL